MRPTLAGALWTHSSSKDGGSAATLGAIAPRSAKTTMLTIRMRLFIMAPLGETGG